MRHVRRLILVVGIQRVNGAAIVVHQPGVEVFSAAERRRRGQDKVVVVMEAAATRRHITGVHAIFVLQAGYPAAAAVLVLVFLHLGGQTTVQRVRFAADAAGQAANQRAGTG